MTNNIMSLCLVLIDLHLLDVFLVVVDGPLMVVGGGWVVVVVVVGSGW